jgi:uroporphyrinogen-III synthase
VKAATTLAANCRALARAWSEDDFHHNRNLASGDADDCVFWLELLAAAGTDQDQPIQALLEEASEIVALLSICGEPEKAPSPAKAEAAPTQKTETPPPPPPMPSDFHGLRVLSFESRMATEMARLIQRHGGEPLVVPALREIPIPLQDNGAVFRFGVKLILQQVDIVILMTGVGTKALFEVLQARYPLAEIIEALKKTIVVTRGPKPLAVLKAMGVEANITVPEPNTWHDVIATLDYYRPVQGLKIAIQEYGVSKPEMIEDLKKRGAEVFSVPVYRWALPEDTGPLEAAIEDVVNGRFDAMVVTNAAQIDHVMQLAESGNRAQQFREACRNLVLASIGPTASEALKHHDLFVDFEPSHPKMGILVKEFSEQVHALRQAKSPPRQAP